MSKRGEVNMTWEELSVRCWRDWLQRHRASVSLDKQLLAFLKSYSAIVPVEHGLHVLPTAFRKVLKRPLKRLVYQDNLGSLVKAFLATEMPHMEEQGSKQSIRRVNQVPEQSVPSSNLDNFVRHSKATEQARIAILLTAENKGLFTQKGMQWLLSEESGPTTARLGSSHKPSRRHDLDMSSASTDAFKAMGNDSVEGDVPFKIVVYLRFKQLCFSPHLRLKQASLDASIEALWQCPNFDWQRVFYQSTRGSMDLETLEKLTDLKRSGWDFSHTVEDDDYQCFRSLTEKNISLYSYYLDEEFPSWLNAMPSIEASALMEDNPEAEGFLGVLLWQIIINHGRFDLLSLCLQPEKADSKELNQWFNTAFWPRGLRDDDIKPIFTQLNQFLTYYQLLPQQYHAFSQCLYALLKRAKLNRVDDIINYSVEWPLLTHYSVVLTIARDMRKDDPLSEVINHVFPLSEVGVKTAKGPLYQEPEGLWQDLSSQAATDAHLFVTYLPSFVSVALARIEQSASSTSLDCLWRVLSTLTHLQGSMPSVLMMLEAASLATQTERFNSEAQLLAVPEAREEDIPQKREFTLTKEEFDTRWRGAVGLPLDDRYPGFDDLMENKWRKLHNSGALEVKIQKVIGQAQVKSWLKKHSNYNHMEVSVPARTTLYQVDEDGELKCIYGDPQSEGDYWVTVVGKSMDPYFRLEKETSSERMQWVGDQLKPSTQVLSSNHKMLIECPDRLHGMYVALTDGSYYPVTWEPQSWSPKGFVSYIEDSLVYRKYPPVIHVSLFSSTYPKKGVANDPMKYFEPPSQKLVLAIFERVREVVFDLGERTIHSQNASMLLVCLNNIVKMKRNPEEQLSQSAFLDHLEQVRLAFVQLLAVTEPNALRRLNELFEDFMKELAWPESPLTPYERVRAKVSSLIKRASAPSSQRISFFQQQQNILNGRDRNAPARNAPAPLAM